MWCVSTNLRSQWDPLASRYCNTLRHVWNIVQLLQTTLTGKEHKNSVILHSFNFKLAEHLKLTTKSVNRYNRDVTIQPIQQVSKGLVRRFNDTGLA